MSQEQQPIEDEVVSFREFGRRIGVTDTAVRKRLFDAAKNPDGALKRSITTNKSGKQPALFYNLGVKEWVEGGGVITSAEVERAADGQPTAFEAAAGVAAAADHVEDTVLFRAKQMRAVAEAKMKTMQMEQMQGKLVPKDKVYAAFFEFGQALRDRLLEMPDKIFSQVVNHIQNGREKEAYNLIYFGIEKILLAAQAGPNEEKITGKIIRDNDDTGEAAT